MTRTLEAKLCALADRHYKRDLSSRLKKLGEEFGELAEAVSNGDTPNILEESADCSFVLMDIAHLAGGSLSSAQKAKWKTLCVRERCGMLDKHVRSQQRNAQEAA